MLQNQLPGYAGYQRLYQREHTTPHVSDVPAHKYDHVSQVHRGLTKGSVYQSEYGARTGPETVVAPRSVALSSSGTFPPLVASVPVVIGDSAPRAGVGAADAIMRSGSRGAGAGAGAGAGGEAKTALSWMAQRTVDEEREAYERRPETVAHWESSYAASHPAHATFAAHRDLSSMHATAAAGRSIIDPSAGLGSSSSLLRAQRATSTYAMDFGTYGSSPMERHNPSDGKSTISRNGTTRDLFHGTTKGTTRIPGYSGHVPAQARNRSTDLLRDPAEPPPPRDVKDNLIFNYRDTLPGYTGHRPRAAINDASVRALRPVGAVPVMKASLILDSMRVTSS